MNSPFELNRVLFVEVVKYHSNLNEIDSVAHAFKLLSGTKHLLILRVSGAMIPVKKTDGFINQPF